MAEFPTSFALACAAPTVPRLNTLSCAVGPQRETADGTVSVFARRDDFNLSCNVAAGGGLSVLAPFSNNFTFSFTASNAIA